MSSYQAGHVMVNMMTGQRTVGFTVHAVRDTTDGPIAWCGVGAISTITGRFQPRLARACTVCAKLVTHPAQRPAD